MKQKLQTLLTELNHGLVEREATLKTALLTVLAGENLVLIGPPGTGKSLIARRIADSFSHDGSNGYFEYLLTKFSTPEEIFGPLSITELKADRFKRNTAGYLPTVKIAFLDEIFKASSSILNALLTILNERVYHNGAEKQDVPMQALIAASNELPTDQEELSALYDRFLVRGFVDYVSQDNLLRLFAKEEAAPALIKLTAVDLKNIQTAVKFVAIPPEIVQAVQRIWIRHKETFKEDRRESLSDRRLKKVIKLLCVSAATNGRTDVDLSDVLLLKDCLWNHQDNALKVRELILNTLKTFSNPVPQIEGTIKATPYSVKNSIKVAAVVKDFKGSGTPQDPLLIQTVSDLIDLGRPDVGLKGYHFRQTADIDCSGIISWIDIPFKGHYDGDGHTIKSNKKEIDKIVIEDGLCELFSKIQAQSSITNLKLEDFRLAKTAEGSHITHCSSNFNFISDTASNCTITDSFVMMNLNGNYLNDEINGIANTLTQGCLVERCFVTGSIQSSNIYRISFSGISNYCNDSTIRQCALGKLTFSYHVELNGRISGSEISSTLKDNISIGSNPGTNKSNGRDGASIPDIQFKQRYFEHTLNWDFDTVWQWDTKEDRPALRSVSVGAALQQAKSATQQAKIADLLTQQISANIWL